MNVAGIYLKLEHVLTIITIINAIFVTFVVYFQYKLAKDKINLELFEKRFNIYKEVEDFFIKILQDGDVTTNMLDN